MTTEHRVVIAFGARRMQAGGLALAVVMGASLLTIVYGLAPGLLPSAGMQQFFLGLARCYAEHLPALRCDAVAQPAGYTTVFGLPYVLPVAVLDRLGMPLLLAGRAVELAYLALALAGGVALCRTLAMRWSIALLVSGLLLVSPIVYAQDNYGPLRIGFSLLAFYGWVDLAMARRIALCRNAAALFAVSVMAIIASTIVRSMALFMDGYSFVMGLMLSAAVITPVVGGLVVRQRGTPAAAALLVYCIPTVLAYWLYTTYVGSAVEEAVMPIDFFRGQGVDLYALAVPSAMQGWAAMLDLHHSLNGWMTYSDGPSVQYVYPGWALIIAAIATCGVFLRRARADRRMPAVMALAAMLLAALVLAMGPSLKLADFREEPPPGRFIEFSDYLMPASAATATLGTAWLYQSVPGVRNMRAVYRWMLLVKLGALIVAGLLLDWMADRRRWRYPALILALLIVAESVPNVAERFARGQQQLDTYQAFQNDALDSLRKMGLEGKRVLLLPYEPDGDWNHFTANFLCPMAALECFNVGGDKSLVMAKSSWPLELRELSRGRWVQSNVEALLFNPVIDEIVIPLFSLRGAAYVWPPSTRQVEDNLQEALALAESAGASATRQGWFVRLSRPESESPVAAPVRLDAPPIEVADWGPRSGSFGHGFNVQMDGRSAFWVLFSEGSSPRDAYMLSLDERVLETFNDARVLSGRLAYRSDRDSFPPGRYPLRLHDRASGRVIVLGEFEVLPP